MYNYQYIVLACISSGQWSIIDAMLSKCGLAYHASKLVSQMLEIHTTFSGIQIMWSSFQIFISIMVVSEQHVIVKVYFINDIKVKIASPICAITYYVEYNHFMYFDL